VFCNRLFYGIRDAFKMRRIVLRGSTNNLHLSKNLFHILEVTCLESSFFFFFFANGFPSKTASMSFFLLLIRALSSNGSFSVTFKSTSLRSA